MEADACSTGYLWLDLLCITGALFWAAYFGAMVERHEEEVVRWLERFNKRFRGEVEPYTLSWQEGGERKVVRFTAVDERDARRQASRHLPEVLLDGPYSTLTRGWRLTPVTDRDELLRQIGERVVERVDDEGFTEENYAACPACGRSQQLALAHEEECPIVNALTWRCWGDH